MPNLELIPTDDLVVELMRRYDHAVFGATHPDRKDETQMIYTRSKGTRLMCRGLCVELMQHITNEMTETVDIDEDEKR